jgi:hypothetical protein
MENTRVQQAPRAKKPVTIYWPGTNVIKSRSNAFDWRGHSSEIMKQLDMQLSNNAKFQAINLDRKT